jgi:hypothetical protein
MARRRVVFGSGLRAGARAVSASLRVLGPVHPVSASHQALVLVPPVSVSLRVPAQSVSASRLVLA